jgi:hypothetical protein
MRHLIVGSLSSALVLVSVATDAFGTTGTSGTTVQQSEARFTTTATAKSAGVRFAIASTDQQNPRNRQPKRITNFTITLPSGSSIDSKTVPQCKATAFDFEQASNPDDACPRGSKVGIGRAAMRLPFPGTSDFPGTVSAYNANKGLLVFMNFPAANLKLLLRAKFSGLTLRIAIPHTCVPPTVPANDCADNFGGRQEAILVQMGLTTRPKSHRTRLGVRKLIRTPRACPSDGWHFRANFKYADGSTLTIPSKSSCRRP